MDPCTQTHKDIHSAVFYPSGQDYGSDECWWLIWQEPGPGRVGKETPVVLYGDKLGIQAGSNG